MEKNKIGEHNPKDYFTSTGKISVKALNNIKIKKDNPFWMPSKNEDIFEVRNIMRQEKELKRAINRTKQKQMGQGINAEPLIENSNNVYLTEQRADTQGNVNDFVEKFNKLKSESQKNVLITIQKADKNKCTKTNYQSATNLLKIKTHQKEASKEPLDRSRLDLIQKKIDSLGGGKKENVRDYINKTRELIMIKYSVDVKKERAVRLQETYNNEIESVKDSIVSMYEAKNLFENEFFVKFQQYVKNLIKQKEHEKNEETNLLETKMRLDAEKSKLSTKIAKVEKEKKNYEECLHFMIKVKEKMLVIPEYYKPDYNQSSRKEKREDTKTSNSRTSNKQVTTFFDRNKQKMKSFKLEGSIISIQEIDKYERIRGYFDGNEIFDSPKDLVDEIKKMENENINRLINLNEINYNLREAQKEISKVREEEKRTYDRNFKDISNKERQLKKLKDKHNKMNEEKNLLLNDNPEFNTTSKDKKGHRNRHSHFKSKLSEPQLFSKILEVFKSIGDLNLHANDYDTNKKNTAGIEQSMLTMLQSIEKSIDFLVARHYDYLKTPSMDTKLREIESNLDFERKQKKSQDMKIQNLRDEQRKIKEMEERNNRIYIVPKRKIPEKCAPKDIGDFEKKKEKDDNKELNFEDFIDY